MKLNILIVYYKRSIQGRKTIDDHLYSFEKYTDHNVFYLNTFIGTPKYLAGMRFNIVLYHYTFMAVKWDITEFERLLKSCEPLKLVKGHKCAMPQDEYIYTDKVCQFFKEFGVETVFTLASPPEYAVFYPPEKSGLKDYHTVLTGYLDENLLEKYGGLLPPHAERKIDISYRTRSLPFWLGRQGRYKSEIARFFQDGNRLHNLRADISCGEDALLGEGWYKFLMNSRTALGCEGGASLLDHDGSIRKRVEEYVKVHPEAYFEEVEAQCFKGLDGKLDYSKISPRIFECCITKTCQVLLEGNYDGILRPGVHYIEVKKDFSNIDEVFEKIKDVPYCEQIAENAYNEVVLSNKYTYKTFVGQVVDKLVPFLSPAGEALPGGSLRMKRLALREKLSFLAIPMLDLEKRIAKFLIKKILPVFSLGQD